jgi:hypothetical protein
MMNVPQKIATKNGLISGFLYGFAQIIQLVLIDVVFYIGSIFVKNNDVTL